MKRTVIGILAHVDAGKTTLSEALLYCSAALRALGRVDHGSALLDNFALERQRGITIFSKQAALALPGLQATLLDTPGHVDFAAEMERTLDVLDCAILVIGGSAGVQSHTRTVWKLLRAQDIPTFLFVNKMDLPGADRAAILDELRRELGPGVADLDDPESAALCDDGLTEEYLERGNLSDESLRAAVARCTVFPCLFGAALRLQGVEAFMDALARYAPAAPAGEAFGARVYKISRDESGARLTHLKVTGGALRVRDLLRGEGWSEKVTQLRVYSGGKYRVAEELLPGDVGAAVGLSRTAPGMGLGAEEQAQAPKLQPVLTYGVALPEGYDVHRALSQLRELEEEIPELQVEWSAQAGELRVRLMGPVQLEILHQLLLDRFGLEVSFGAGAILYRETIAAPVEGVGHYEPLRHYAEVHLLLEPGERGSGLRFETACREDDLDRAWQHLILTHLAETTHPGVLTGAPITDMTITLMSGRGHLKHTEGGDFRQATYRAVRQGLMCARSILLEPWYDFALELPQAQVGRALSDLQRMGAETRPPETAGDRVLLRGAAPVAALRDYPRELTAYTHGEGRFSCALRGYEPCRDQEEVVRAAGYDPEADLERTPDSVFCSHGAGVNVKWSEVPRHMHLPSVLTPPKEEPLAQQAARYCAMVASDQELMRVFERTYGPIKRDVRAALRPVKRDLPPKGYKAAPPLPGPEYLLVDGYNIIFSWDELRALAETGLDLARNRLIDILRSYQGVRQHPVIVVFDAYKVKDNPGSVERLGGLSVVYTKEAETADMYIERVTSTLGRQHRVRVATSDVLEQVIILGHNTLRVTAEAFQEEVRTVERALRAYLVEPQQ